MNISKGVYISFKATLDKSVNPKGIHIGEHTYILANAVILSHDWSRNLEMNTYVGKNCIVGINSIVLPGVKVGDHVLIGAGSVVTKDIPSHCIVVGNPAKIIREGVWISDKGQLTNNVPASKNAAN